MFCNNLNIGDIVKVDRSDSEWVGIVTVKWPKSDCVDVKFFNGEEYTYPARIVNLIERNFK
jgi:hypothetical protein